MAAAAGGWAGAGNWREAYHVADAAIIVVMIMIGKFFMVSWVRDEAIELFEGGELHGDEAALFEADSKERAAGI